MKIDPRRIEVIDDSMAEVLRRKTGPERLAIANGLIRSARSILHSHISSTHPDWTPEQVAREVARRFSHGVV
jgi:hypothetical protein